MCNVQKGMKIIVSSMYYIGIITGNIVYKPIEISGATERCVEKLLDYSGIDIYSNFNYFNDDNARLLFYKLTKEDRELINISFVNSDDCKTKIEYNEFPIICDDKILKNENSYHLNTLKSINYNNFHIINNLSYGDLDKILKNISAWQSNKSLEFFVDEIVFIYKIISKWILNEENIYWWQYL